MYLTRALTPSPSDGYLRRRSIYPLFSCYVEARHGAALTTHTTQNPLHGCAPAKTTATGGHRPVLRRRSQRTSKKLDSHVGPTRHSNRGVQFLCFLSSYLFIFCLFIFHLTYSRWTSSLPSCLWSQRIFPSLPGSRLTIFLSRCKFSTLTTRQPMVEFLFMNTNTALRSL